MAQTGAGDTLAGKHGRTVILIALVAICCGLVLCCRLAFRTAVVCSHIGYVPVVLTGLWFGRRSIWVACLIGTFIVLLGLVMRTSESVLADLLRAFCLLGVGACVGIISETAAKARKAEEASRKVLERTHRQLRASERLASMGQLAAGVAHELNNPLGTILLYSHMLLKQLRQEDPQRADIEIIASEATRCGTIVRALLDFARQSQVSKAPTDLAGLIDDVVRVMAAKARAAGVSLTVDVQEGLPPIMIDADQVKQVLVNLVQNGVDAISQEGTVRIRAREVPAARAVEILVEDTGRGIAPENMGKLFTPFFTTKQADKGTGLGLALAYGVVKMHSGAISAENEPGRGTVFRVRIPIGEGGEEDERLSQV